MSKQHKTPQRPKQYRPKIEKEKSFKIHNVIFKKKLKHRKDYYNDNEFDSQ